MRFWQILPKSISPSGPRPKFPHTDCTGAAAVVVYETGMVVLEVGVCVAGDGDVDLAHVSPYRMR